MKNPQNNGNAAGKIDMYEPTLVVATFLKSVIERFQITIDNRLYTYQEYLSLPISERSNDEADAVDQRFARYTLEWLGFEEADWNYNRPQSGQKANRPDYTVKTLVGTAFIWEDKNSTVELDREHLVQMYRYCIGTADYAVWCNMRRLLAIRFLPGDTFLYEILADVSIAKLLGAEQDKQSTNLALFRLLFGRERFHQFNELVEHICVDEQTFVSNAAQLDRPQAMQQFIAGSRQSLDHLRLAALARIREALEHRDDVVQARAIHINSALLEQRFKATELFGIAEAYDVWSERQSDLEDMKPEVFAEQVAYVFFVRLLLVRVLEDKGILRPRFMSNGGFRDWNEYVRRHFKELDSIGVLNESYSHILARKASHYYIHFFQQAIFDWFSPEDFLFVETLEFLCRFNFQNIASDLIGFTYEEYIDRNARNRKGHFLTRHEVVEYMLDVLDYSGSQVVGRRILDPACGSGSFLVHAARRYRRALVTYLCNLHSLPDDEEALAAHPELQQELARRYLDDLTALFFGMELNPFACYLAEMNLLIQGLNDYLVLQQAGDILPVDRFRIYNTNSLDLPREILDSSDVTGTLRGIPVKDYLSERIIDESYPIKAGLDNYVEGFFYVISNPPYVSSKQEEFDVGWFRRAAFYKAVLSGDTNLYLLFLRLGLYYLSEYGQMVYIIPLTIFGDKSASTARQLLKTPPFSPAAAIRFYRGDILFPGVDQAVGIVRVNRSFKSISMVVSGGNTIEEARAAQFNTAVENVVEAVPQNHIWQSNWLVAPGQKYLEVWDYVKKISNNLSTQLEALLDDTFDRKQGDVNATYVNPLRLGRRNGNFSDGDIALYKGENVKGFAPLPVSPSDWVRTLQDTDRVGPVQELVFLSQTLEQLKRIEGKEVGIVLREVARLNTRERLMATWFERMQGSPIAFTHELWRMSLKEGASEKFGKALLALINSKAMAYLVNLFSTNNHVGKDDLGRVPIPDPQTMPVERLAGLAEDLFRERAAIESDFVEKYRARLPGFDDGKVYVPPSAVLAMARLPKLTMQALVGRGEVRNVGAANGRIRALRARNMIVATVASANPDAAAFAQVLDLFLQEPDREADSWLQAQSWQLPDTVAATAWLQMYNTISQQVQASWNRFVTLQKQVDEAVADWYGFSEEMRATIAEGLPWARKRREETVEEI